MPSQVEPSLLRSIVTALVATFLAHVLGVVAAANWVRPRAAAGLAGFISIPVLLLAYGGLLYGGAVLIVAVLLDLATPLPVLGFFRWVGVALVLWLTPHCLWAAAAAFGEKHTELHLR